MAQYPLSDVVGLYPRLQEIAHLTRDEGDLSPTAIPYQISPDDIQEYYKSRREPLTIGGRELTLFEIVELYRQLVLFDKKDGNIDGKIGTPKDKETVYLPRFAHGYHYWGKGWTPEKRVDLFIETYRSSFDELMKTVNQKFPNARSYLEGKIDSSRTRIRSLRNEEKEFVHKTAEGLRNNQKPQYADLLEKALDVMNVLSVYTAPEMREPAYTQASSFGYSHLFPADGENQILLISYPQFKQWNFFDRRHCAKIEGVERCMPLVGLNTRKDVIRNYLKVYSLGEDLLDGNEKTFGYKWARMSQYLLRTRVYNYFKYAQDIPQDLFFRMLVLHETLHYRNSSLGLMYKTSGSTEKVKLLLLGLTDPYICNIIKGEYYVNIQRSAMERKLELTMEIEDLKQANAHLGPEKTEYIDQLRGQISFLEQLGSLAGEAEENIIENEVYDVFFGAENLREHPWATETTQILNPNEVELIKREEGRKISD